MKRRPLAIALLALGLAAAAAGAENTETREAAAVLVVQADAARNAGDGAAAVALLDRALELCPGYPDALYRRGLVRLADREATRAAVVDLRASLAGGWTGSDADEAALALATALVRTRQATEAIPMLVALAGRRPADPRPLAALAAAYRSTGKDASALATLSEGRSRFPGTSSFVLDLGTMLAAAGRAAEAFALVDAAAAESPADPRLALGRAVLETDPARRVSAVERALSAGSRDPLAPLVALESRPSPADGRTYLDLFLANGGLVRVELAERAARAVAADKDLAAAFDRALAGYTGPRELDRDGDGWWEERWDLSAGVPVRWILDTDQDGVSEYDAALEAGQPRSLAYHPSPEAVFTLFYGVYPWIDHVAELGPSGARRWTLASRAIGAPFLGLPGPRVPTAAEVQKAAVRLEENAGTAGGRRWVELKDGRRLYLEEDTDGDGRIDHRLWYEADRPVRGARDLAGDGVFEATETWTDGSLARLSVDTDGDGRPDYAEVYRPATARLWDYNQDGRDDARETADGKGGLVREFSTKADGRFDLRILFRDGAIVEVRRDGRAIAATPDAARGVTWIGPVPKSATIDATVPDGYRTFGGREYLLFRHGTAVYVEALP